MEDEQIRDLELKSMEMILHAGDGRHLVMKALDDLERFDFDVAQQKLGEAAEEIRKAHEVQTGVLQAVAGREINEEYSVLFSHAQDTLMTIYSEYNIAKKLMAILNAVDRRFRTLEEAGR